MTVSNGGSLGGIGTFGGNVSISDGVLAPGNSAGTLTINGNLSLAPASVLNYEFGQAGVVGGPLNDLTVVGGNLTLDGTLNVSASAGGTFGPGLYRLISYGGTLTDNGLDLGTQPAGSVNSVQTAVAGQVNLINTAGLAMDFWDGGVAPRNNGRIDGGHGVWQASAGNDNWADSTGAVNGTYASGTFAVFAGTPGTVTVDNSLGAVVSGGMQFATSGYVLQGQPITLATGSNVLRVGDGTAPGAGYVATIAAELAGSGGIDKTDLGTLVLAGTNSYTGGTTISGGTLEISQRHEPRCRRRRADIQWRHAQDRGRHRHGPRDDARCGRRDHRDAIGHPDAYGHAGRSWRARQDRDRHLGPGGRQHLHRRHDHQLLAPCNWATAARPAASWAM